MCVKKAMVKLSAVGEGGFSFKKGSKKKYKCVKGRVQCKWVWKCMKYG